MGLMHPKRCTVITDCCLSGHGQQH